MRLSDFNQNNDKEPIKNSKLSEQDVMNKYNQYKDLSQEQLNKELFKEVARQKQAGTFDYSKLEGMLESLKGSLSTEDYMNMKRILESLK